MSPSSVRVEMFTKDTREIQRQRGWQNYTTHAHINYIISAASQRPTSASAAERSPHNQHDDDDDDAGKTDTGPRLTPRPIPSMGSPTQTTSFPHGSHLAWFCG